MSGQERSPGSGMGLWPPEGLGYTRTPRQPSRHRNTMKPLVTPILALLLLSTTLGSAAAAVPVPAPPQGAAKSYLLIAHHGGVVLAEHDADQRMEPASIVKLMTAYAVF